MRRAVAVVVVVAVTLVLTALPGSAEPVEGPAGAREQQAVELLLGASQAARSLSYTGTERVATWSSTGSSVDLVAVHHDARTGFALEAETDPRRIVLLAAAYDLAVVGPGRCAGRSAHVIEATRPDGSLAARFWVDRDTGLLLRREVRGDDGRRLWGSAFVDVDIEAAGRTGPAGAQLTRSLPGAPTVRGLQDDGWQVPSDLPGGLRLFETDLDTAEDGEQVLHLAYSDGLVHVSLFVQQGELGSRGVVGFQPDTIGAQPVWLRHADQEQAVWSGAGQVWTLVSDASPERVRAAVAALPRDDAPADGLGSRLGRGMTRLMSMLNVLT